MSTLNDISFLSGVGDDDLESEDDGSVQEVCLNLTVPSQVSHISFLDA